MILQILHTSLSFSFRAEVNQKDTKEREFDAWSEAPGTWEKDKNEVEGGNYANFVET